jgi:hypothetical protein
MGYIYDINVPRQADLWVKTTKQIAEYLGRTLIDGDVIEEAVKTLKIPVVEKPIEPTPIPPATTLSLSETMIFNELVKEYVKEEKRLKKNLKVLQNIVWNNVAMNFRISSRVSRVLKTLRMVLILLSPFGMSCLNLRKIG